MRAWATPSRSSARDAQPRHPGPTHFGAADVSGSLSMFALSIASQFKQRLDNCSSWLVLEYMEVQTKHTAYEGSTGSFIGVSCCGRPCLPGRGCMQA